MISPANSGEAVEYTPLFFRVILSSRFDQALSSAFDDLVRDERWSAHNLVDYCQILPARECNGCLPPGSCHIISLLKNPRSLAVLTPSEPGMIRWNLLREIKEWGNKRANHFDVYNVDIHVTMPRIRTVLMTDLEMGTGKIGVDVCSADSGRRQTLLSSRVSTASNA